MIKKKILRILTFFFLFVKISPLFSKVINFKLFPYIGFEYSSFEEAYYYDNSLDYSDNLCSLLEWKQNPSFIVGLKTDINLKNFSWFIDFSTKFPMKCGYMYDSDYWENGIKFNYSINENYLNGAFSIDSGFSYFIKIHNFLITPSIFGSYSYIFFSAKNGYGWYAGSADSSDGQVHSWDSSYAHYYPDGKYHLAGVDYKNQTFYFMFGLDFSRIFFEKWQPTLGLYVSPFTYVYVIDHHLGKTSNFYSEDYIYNYFKNYKFIFTNTFFVCKYFSLVSVLEGNLQLLTKGKNYENKTLNSQMGGESYKALRFEIGMKFSF